MELLRRPLIALSVTAALVAALAVPAFAADPQSEKPQVAVAKPGTIGVQTCKSNKYYAGRQLSFRATIARQQSGTPQKLSVKIEVWRKFRTEKRFKRLKLAGDTGWSTASDLEAGAYQHDLIISPNAIETRASYRARATFRWSNADTGVTEARKTVWSKVCEQRVKPPKLRIYGLTSVPVPGVAEMTYTVTVYNKGKAEAVNVPVGISVDGAPPIIATIDSLGPQQAGDVQITAPSCVAQTTGQIDPLRKMISIANDSRARFPAFPCK